MFPGLRGLTAASFRRDLAAGLTLAAIAIPEQMATARLGGFPPLTGLFVFVVASLAFAAFGANRQLSAGADSTITTIFAGSLALLAAAGSARYGELAAVLALLVGVSLVAAGALKLGWVADLLSRPVITGFLAGIAAHIVLSQAPAVLGLPEVSGTLLRRLSALWAERGAVNPIAVAVGLAAFLASTVAEKINPRIPGALLALIGATALTMALDLGARGLPVLGRPTGGLPQLHWPQLTAQTVLPLLGLAFIVSLMAMVQTGATTRSFNPGEPDVDRDFVGVGAGCLAAAFLGGFPVNASPPRTALVAQAGGGSQWAGLSAAVAVLLLAAFGARLLSFVPTAALAGVLLFVAARIVHLRTFEDLARRTRAEFALALFTAVLIIALPIQAGVAIGVFLSLAHGVFTITRARPVRFEQVPGSTVWWPAAEPGPTGQGSGVLVIGFQAPLSFLNAYDFRRGILRAVAKGGREVRLVILEASSIAEIDFTAAEIVVELITQLRSQGIELAVARLESVRAMAAFDRLGITAALGHDHLFHSVAEAIARLEGERPAATAPRR